MDLTLPPLLLAFVSLVGLPVLLWRRHLQRRRRILLEDGLKHFYDAEYKGRQVSLQSLAGILGVDLDRAFALLNDMEAEGLIRRQGENLGLNATGRRYALRVIRGHRLWERYLAEKTGTNPLEWHNQAEKQEHALSSSEADILEKKMGPKAYDPHGDPIPTTAGDLPPHRGRALTDLPIGTAGTLIHLEDEPGALYAQLVAADLAPGMHIEVGRSSRQGIHFRADGRPKLLAAAIAANITILPDNRDHGREKGFETLADLRVGEEAQVIRLAKTCRGFERQRLMDLGILPGTTVAAQLKSPAGDPKAYSVRHTLIALRHEQAEKILIDGRQKAEPC